MKYKKGQIIPVTWVLGTFISIGLAITGWNTNTNTRQDKDISETKVNIAAMAKSLEYITKAIDEVKSTQKESLIAQKESLKRDYGLDWDTVQKLVQKQTQ